MSMHGANVGLFFFEHLAVVVLVIYRISTKNHCHKCNQTKKPYSSEWLPINTGNAKGFPYAPTGNRDKNY
ncbi:hypothetical protein SAMN04244574_03554 [Azotobacter beijerinckii]|uniref:Uncharacterized protein n=1 Tax=Azotobacter beijerinckii TaxID=170623 RepID=A0A1I4FUY9_9GAMM|nr:hypothetical protein SAMN04244571_04335 [Azotobacter beijerinckii]SFL21363.1 hypothetical protein SAMN04244574_03554 [Azotobacter beijerinckii]